MGSGVSSEQTEGWWVMAKSLGELVMEANIEEIALTSLRMQGLEAENERLRMRVAELERLIVRLRLELNHASLATTEAGLITMAVLREIDKTVPSEVSRPKDGG